VGTKLGTASTACHLHGIFPRNEARVGLSIRLRPSCAGALGAYATGWVRLQSMLRLRSAREPSTPCRFSLRALHARARLTYRKRGEIPTERLVSRERRRVLSVNRLVASVIAGNIQRSGVATHADTLRLRSGRSLLTCGSVETRPCFRAVRPRTLRVARCRKRKESSAGSFSRQSSGPS
jgi:hypothetical protein